MKNLIVLIAVAIFALINVVPAFADGRDNDISGKASVAYRNKGNMYKITYTAETIKIKKHNNDDKSCTIKSDVVTLDAYLDGDTPVDVAYSDYQEDLVWWANEVHTPCTVIVEPLP